MNGVKLGIVAVCVGLLGLCIAADNFFAICCGVAAVLLSVAACFAGSKKNKT